MGMDVLRERRPAGCGEECDAKPFAGAAAHKGKCCACRGADAVFGSDAGLPRKGNFWVVAGRGDQAPAEEPSAGEGSVRVFDTLTMTGIPKAPLRRVRTLQSFTRLWW